MDKPNIRIGKILCALALVFATTACTMGGVPYKKSEVPEDMAVIHIYRTRVFVGGAVMYPIYVNGKKVCTLPHTAYYSYPVEPGEVFIKADTLENEAHVRIDAEAGREYYIKGGTATGTFAGRATLAQVHPQQGREEIKDCVYYPAHDALN